MAGQQKEAVGEVALNLFQKLEDLSVEQSAPLLLGQVLVREIDGQRLAGKIVETEAYHQTDPASHSFRGWSTRTAAMFGPAGRAYIYFTYGLHYCLNVTAGPDGHAAAILIRALEPLEGIEQMYQNRSSKPRLQGMTLQNLCKGPGKLTQALAIDKSLYGHDLTKPPLYLEEQALIPPEQIIATTRIGITKALDSQLRFYIKSNPFISKA